MTTSIPWAQGARGLAVQADVARREKRAEVIQAEQVEQWAGVATNEDDIAFIAAITQAIVAVTPRVALSPAQAARLAALVEASPQTVDVT